MSQIGKLVLAGMLVTAVSVLHADKLKDERPENVVRQFVDAYNNRDLEGMVQLSHSDIRWMSVTDEGVDTATSSADELAEVLTGYFSSPLASTSKLLSVEALGNSVTTIEQATWNNAENEVLSQCSIAVYMISDGRVDSVWYFPEQACP